MHFVMSFRLMSIKTIQRLDNNRTLRIGLEILKRIFAKNLVKLLYQASIKDLGTIPTLEAHINTYPPQIIVV